MVVGVGLGVAAPGFMSGLRGLEFGEGSQINVPIAVLIWLMTTAMMMRVDFGAIREVGRRPRGLFVTLFVNWLVKPFSMALIAWVFFRFLFSPWIPHRPSAGGRRVAGHILGKPLHVALISEVPVMLSVCAFCVRTKKTPIRLGRRSPQKCGNMLLCEPQWNLTRR